MNPEKLKIRKQAAEQKRHWVRLTNACNQRCVFCHDRERQEGGVIAFAQVVEELKRGRKRGCRRTVLSGGEPTLHPELPKIIRTAKRLGYSHVQLVTNGRMFFYGDFVQALKQAGLDEVTLSLHSHLEKTFEEITQVRGSYRQAMKGLLNALEGGFIVSIDIVINQKNYRALAETVKFFMRLGVSEFDLLHLIPFGEAWKHREDVYYSISKAKKYLDKVFELSKKDHVYLWTNRLPAMYLEGYEELIQDPCKLHDEAGGMAQELQAFVQTGQPPGCRGERCGYCFMDTFCRDLVRLREEKILFAYEAPLCLAKARQGNAASYRFRKDMSIDRFLDFFIQYRYHVKSLRCRNCRVYKQCNGAYIEEIRAKGFKILVPVEK